MAYNVTFIETNNTIFDAMVSVNVESGGWLMRFVLIAFFFILFMAMKHYNTKAAILVATYITSVLGVVFVFLGWVSLSTIIYFVVGCVVATIIFYFTDS